MKWLWVPGYEGLYRVSDDGDVMHVAGRDSIGRYRDARALTPNATRTGYRKVSLSKNSVVWVTKVHKLVMLAFVGPRPDLMVVNHKDGDKANNTLANLEYVTVAENEAHALRNGLKPSHERHGQAKLTRDQVSECHRRSALGETHTSIAKDFSVHITTISNVVTGKTWRGVNHGE